MPRNRFALAVGIGRQKNFRRVSRQFLQFLDHIFFLRRNHIVRSKIIFDVNAHLLLRQIADVTNRRAHTIAGAEKFADGFRFGGRFDNHQATDGLTEDGRRTTDVNRFSVLRLVKCFRLATLLGFAVVGGLLVAIAFASAIIASRSTVACASLLPSRFIPCRRPDKCLWCMPTRAR